MPYTGPGDDSLPSYVQELPEDKRAQWVEVWNSVYQDCKDDDGEDDECEAAAFRQANGVVMNRQLQFVRNDADVAQVRHETVDGVNYLVAPVVAVREGVMNGELVTGDEIAHHFATWNGRPFMLGHPQNEDGESVTANDPAVLAKLAVGQLFNVEFIDGLLRGEVWVNITRAKTLGAGALELVRRLEKGQPVEVSTAYFRDREEQAGEFNGTPYEAVAHNLKPDHLAALLDEKGACSWEDGCGVPRVNQARYDHIDFTPTDAMAEEAQRGLDWRDEHGRGGTEVGIARARDIANQRTLSPETVKRMVSFFSRHEVDKKAEGFSPGEDGYPSNGRIAWSLWGGDVGFAWARARAEQMDAVDASDQEGRNVINNGMIHNDELAVHFTGSPRNPYGTHGSVSYPGGRDAWKRAWRIHLSQVNGGALTPAASAPLRGTIRRLAMIAKAMKPPCDLPSGENIGAREGQKSPLSGEYKEKPKDYGMSRWKKPADDDLTQEDIQLTCQDLKDLKVIVMQEINRRIADREKEEQSSNSKVANAWRTIAQALGLADASPAENEASLEDLPRRVRIAWENEHTSNDGMFTGPYVEEVLTDSVIVREEQGLLSIPFSEGDDGDISFGQPTRVEVVYQPISEQQEVNMDELIAQIVEDGRLGVSEDVLADASEDLLKAVVALLESIPQEQEAEPETEAEEEQPPAEAQPEASEAPDFGALTERLEAQGALIDALRKQMEAMAANANAAEQERRAGLVQVLATNASCALTKAQLETLDLDTLEGLQRSLVPGDYSGQGGAPATNLNGRQVELRLAPEWEVSDV